MIIEDNISKFLFYFFSAVVEFEIFKFLSKKIKIITGSLKLKLNSFFSKFK